LKERIKAFNVEATVTNSDTRRSFPDSRREWKPFKLEATVTNLDTQYALALDIKQKFKVGRLIDGFEVCITTRIFPSHTDRARAPLEL
jgi:hypothetical protein